MIRTVQAGLLLAAAGLALGGTLAGVDAAAASSHTHTLRVTAVQLKSTQHKDAFVQAEKDLQHGKVTGYDTVACVANVKTHKGSCDATLARPNGLLYLHAVISFETGKGTGRVTGGTRAYKGATGTVTLAPGATERQTRITAKYHG